MYYIYYIYYIYSTYIKRGERRGAAGRERGSWSDKHIDIQQSRGRDSALWHCVGQCYGPGVAADISGDCGGRGQRVADCRPCRPPISVRGTPASAATAAAAGAAAAAAPAAAGAAAAIAAAPASSTAAARRSPPEALVPCAPGIVGQRPAIPMKRYV